MFLGKDFYFCWSSSSSCYWLALLTIDWPCKREGSLNPMGQMVSVNGHDMSVFVKGEGAQTLVFLSGAGTASPILDFKDLYDGLSKQYKIVVVERGGYGYSEDTSKSRDVSRFFQRHVKP